MGPFALWVVGMGDIASTPPQAALPSWVCGEQV